jgi:hypothetical protein
VDGLVRLTVERNAFAEKNASQARHYKKLVGGRSLSARPNSPRAAKLKHIAHGRSGHEKGNWMLTDRFADALTFAEKAHREQRRKGNDIPYVAHLMAVSATVLEWGGDEDTAIAALLHDAVEDQGGEPMAEEIRQRFGNRVAELVLHCTDSTSSDPETKAPWEERKTAYLARLATADAGAALITAADKLHNMTAIVRDIRAHGPATLDRFNEPDRLIWYYRSVAKALVPHRTRVPLAELNDTIEQATSLLAECRPDA